MRDLPGTEHRKGREGEREKGSPPQQGSAGALGGKGKAALAATLRSGGGGAAGRGRLPSAGHMRGAGGWAEAVAAAGAEVGLG